RGTSLAVQVRTGNVGEPDATWSSWSPPTADPDAAPPSLPAGRFVQLRVTLATEDAARTPELRSVAVHYQTLNQPPELSKLAVPDVTTGDGATRQARLTVRWDASDPNDDDLQFRLDLRKDGWPDWVRITETPLTDKTYAWD